MAKAVLFSEINLLPSHIEQVRVNILSRSPLNHTRTWTSLKAPSELVSSLNSAIPVCLLPVCVWRVLQFSGRVQSNFFRFLRGLIGCMTHKCLWHFKLRELCKRWSFFVQVQIEEWRCESEAHPESLHLVNRGNSQVETQICLRSKLFVRTSWPGISLTCVIPVFKSQSQV